MFFCPYVLRVSGSLRRQPLCFFGHADVSPWPAAQRPFVYLMKTYVAYVFRAKRLTQALYLLFLCSFVLMFSALAANLIERSILLSIRFMVVNTICFSTKVKCCKGNTEVSHSSKKVYNLYTNICPLPVIPLIKECVRFYCHLTLFVRNRLIYRGFKSVR